MYVGPCTEEAITHGKLETAVRAAMITAWGDWRDDIGNVGFDTEADFDLVIASYVHADEHNVVSIDVEIPVATQRRRQDQMR